MLYGSAARQSHLAAQEVTPFPREPNESQGALAEMAAGHFSQ